MSERNTWMRTFVPRAIALSDDILHILIVDAVELRRYLRSFLIRESTLIVRESDVVTEEELLRKTDHTLRQYQPAGPAGNFDTK